MPQHEADSCTRIPRAEAVARLNDQLRKDGACCTILTTRTVRDLPGFDGEVLLKAIADYDAFDSDNDPHGERDFGDLTLFGADLLWKIDYYDIHTKYGSNDPSDPSVTRRILTVMLGSEW